MHGIWLNNHVDSVDELTLEHCPRLEAGAVKKQRTVNPGTTLSKKAGTCIAGPVSTELVPGADANSYRSM